MIFLTSQASHTLSLLLPQLKDKPENLSVAFIPTAADPSKSKPWVGEDRNKLIEMGFKVFDLDLKDKKKEDLEDSLKDVDMVFVAGGNTFYLLEKAISSGFNKLVKELVNRDVVYIGSSAGSVIAGPNIEAVKDFDDSSEAAINSTQGFGLVDFVTLPHFKNKKNSTLHDKVLKEYSERYKIISITDQQAVLVVGNKYQIVEV